MGINWQGNPSIEKDTLKDRSIPLEMFYSIIKSNNISFLSLQKGFGSEQLDNCSFKDKFVSCQDEINKIWDFNETAAIIENCDLIITSDTAIAHLAGGLGKKTFLLLQNIPDWRWGLKGEKTFWYPSVKLFRQESINNNWVEVVNKIS